MLGRADGGESPTADISEGWGDDTVVEYRPGDEPERILRRSLGPTAWAVLGDLGLDARPDDNGILVVVTSARRVGVNVGIGKDAAARAVRRLIAVGVLRRRPQGTDNAGRFSRGTYELRLQTRPPSPPNPPAAITTPHPRAEKTDTGSDSAPVSALSATATRAVPSRRRTRATQTTGPARGDQLCLLEPTTGADNGDTEVGS